MSDKLFLTLENQCTNLKNNKSIVISDAEKAENILLETNYFNLISCSKVKFAKGLSVNGDHIYAESPFEEWVSYFDKDCKVSEYLMQNMIRLERSLNSRLAYYLSELIESEILLEDEFENLKRVIQGENSFTRNPYNGKLTWIFISKKTFGELRHILKYLFKNGYRDVVFKVVDGYSFLENHPLKRIDELVNLRNSIFHFRLLSIYLVHGKFSCNFSQYNLRKKIVEEVFFQNPCVNTKPLMIEIFNSAKVFIGIKKTAELHRLKLIK